MPRQSLSFFFALILCTGFSKISAQDILLHIRRADVLRQDFHLDESFRILKAEEGKALKNRPEKLPQIYAAFSRYYISAENNALAKSYADKAYEAGKKYRNTRGEGYGLYALAYYYFQLDISEQALAYAKPLQKLVERHPDDADDLAAKTYSLLYRIHSQWEDPELTGKYADRALEAASRSGNMDELANNYNAKSSVMGFALKKYKKTAYSDSILHYLRKSADLYRHFPELISKRAYAITNINIANRFFASLQERPGKSTQDSILKYLDNIDRIKNLNDFNFELKANALGIKAELALRNGKPGQAEAYLLDALNGLKSNTKSPANYTMMNVLSSLTELYKGKGDYKSALKYAEEKSAYSQKEYDAAAAQTARSLEARYGNEKLKAELEFAHNRSRWRMIFLYLLAIICVLIISTLYFTRKNFLAKIREQKKLEESLRKEKIQADTQLRLENETRARLIAEQKILLLEKEKMQREAMASALQIERKNETLKEIKDRIANQPEHYQLQAVLKKEARIDGSVEESVRGVPGIQQGFFEKLDAASDNLLTDRDKKICAHVYLGLGNKDIATLCNVEPKTIRMTKYRIKQKLKLGAEVDLSTFLKSLG